MRRPTIFDMMTLEDYRADIARYIENNGSYTHNLISLTLRQVDRQFGLIAANQIVDDFGLTKKFGIHKRTSY